MTDKVSTVVTTEKASLEMRVAALELQAKTWYERHLPFLSWIAGGAIGLVLGHFVR